MVATWDAGRYPDPGLACMHVHIDEAVRKKLADNKITGE